VHWIHVRANLFKFLSNVIEVNVRSETISPMQRCFCGEINTYIVCGEFAVDWGCNSQVLFANSGKAQFKELEL